MVLLFEHKVALPCTSLKLLWEVSNLERGKKKKREHTSKAGGKSWGGGGRGLQTVPSKSLNEYEDMSVSKE